MLQGSAPPTGRLQINTPGMTYQSRDLLPSEGCVKPSTWLSSAWRTLQRVWFVNIIKTTWFVMTTRSDRKTYNCMGFVDPYYVLRQ